MFASGITHVESHTGITHGIAHGNHTWNHIHGITHGSTYMELHTESHTRNHTWNHIHGITYMDVGNAGFGDDEDDHQEAAGSCQAPCQSLCPPSSSTSPSTAAPTPSSPRFAHCCSIGLKCQNAASQCSVSVPLLFFTCSLPFAMSMRPSLSSRA